MREFAFIFMHVEVKQLVGTVESSTRLLGKQGERKMSASLMRAQERTLRTSILDAEWQGCKMALARNPYAVVVGFQRVAVVAVAERLSERE